MPGPVHAEGDRPSKRQRPDRHSGVLLPCHARPLGPQEGRSRRHPTQRVDKGKHFTITHNALNGDEIQWALQLQQDCKPDRLDAETAAFVGTGKHVWSAWPHACGSSVTCTAASHVRRIIDNVLDQVGACPACAQDGSGHKVLEVTMMHYRGSRAACPVHRDSLILDEADCPERQQGALLIALKQACQGGILYVADRPCGRIVQPPGRGPQDIARDAAPLLLDPGDAVMLANVDHCVTALASGTRALLSARLACPRVTNRPRVSLRY